MVFRVTCSPVYIRLDQNLLSFAREFVNSMNLTDAWQIVDEEADEEMPAESSGVAAYIRSCHIEGFALSVGYIPAFVDMGALRKGSYKELLNIMPKCEATLWLQDLDIYGAEGLSALGTVAATRWVQNILAVQIHRFSISVPGRSPVSIGDIGKTLTDFAALPANPSKKTLKQLQKAILAFLSLLANEGRGIGATVTEAWKNRR
jgi:hypothetical protein